MAVEDVRNYFKENNIEKEILRFPTSSATVELAAKALGTEEARIAKTLAFYSPDKEHALLLVTAGDRKADNGKFRSCIGIKPRMLAAQDVKPMTGHESGGVCPFANPPRTEVYLDVSLQRFDTVFPAAGGADSAVELTCGELFDYAKAKAWVDVCKSS